jgi:hypothetical protein
MCKNSECPQNEVGIRGFYGACLAMSSCGLLHSTLTCPVMRRRLMRILLRLLSPLPNHLTSGQAAQPTYSFQ